MALGPMEIVIMVLYVGVPIAIIVFLVWLMHSVVARQKSMEAQLKQMGDTLRQIDQKLQK
ncbi:MAG: hypothetical protein ACI4B6_00360 [Atopobiaceae bacterium]